MTKTPQLNAKERRLIFRFGLMKCVNKAALLFFYRGYGQGVEMKTLISIVLLLVILHASSAMALPPNDFEPWRMYAVYETGYDLGKDIMKGVYGNVSLLQGCMEKLDYSSWKATGWDTESIRKAEKLFFYGCINAVGNRMTKEEFMKDMFMTEVK